MFVPILIAAGIAISAFLGVIAYRTNRFVSRQVPVQPAAPFAVDRKQAVDRMSQALKFKTISNDDRSHDEATFKAFVAFLQASFPRVHKTLLVERVNELSLLYTWRGSDRSNKPVLMMGHYDVVPVEPGTEKDWTYPPYDGVIAGGFIWGRGAWDDKSGVMGILEAVEKLLEEGFIPSRDMYFCFGHDEEVHGMQGAAKIADLLAQRQIQFDFVLDEGLFINDGIISEVKQRVAMVGIAEKGFMSVELSAVAQGGHSSRPPIPDAIGLVAQAITRLEADQVSPKITAAVAAMYDYIGPETTGFQKVVMANRWLFDPLLKREIVKSTLRAQVITTKVPTIIHAGIKENVVPSHALAVVNLRILTGQTVEAVLDHIKNVINDPRVKVTPMFATAGPTMPRMDPHSFALIAGTIRQIFPDAMVAPSLVMGRTDSRHFEKLAGSVYRFNPIIVKPEDTSRFHGTNERVGVDNYVEAIQFYRQLILNCNKK